MVPHRAAGRFSAVRLIFEVLVQVRMVLVGLFAPDSGGTTMGSTQIGLPAGVRADRAAGYELLKILLAAGGAFRRRRGMQHQVFKSMIARSALVLVERHKPIEPPQ
jgi:hypothetical protein